jgi:hypothetical protein
MKRLIYGILCGLWHTWAMGITCTEKDFQPALCDLPILEGVRCAHAEFFRSYCTNQTDGCAGVGGCFGFTPPGHWYPVLGSNGLPFRRCRCGCFGEETRFTGRRKVTGRDLISGEFSMPALLVAGYGRGKGNLFFSIDGLVHSIDERAIHILTEGAHEIYLSDTHPVLLVTQSNRWMQQAKEVKIGDFLLSEAGIPRRVIQVESVLYGKEMVNFQVQSTNPLHHIVIANGLQMGDLAWQEQLHSVEARMHHRQDLMQYLLREEGGVP